MHSRRMLSLGSLLAMLLLLIGCASKPVTVAECPRFQPSKEALAPVTADLRASHERLMQSVEKLKAAVETPSKPTTE